MRLDGLGQFVRDLDFESQDTLLHLFKSNNQASLNKIFVIYHIGYHDTISGIIKA